VKNSQASNFILEFERWKKHVSSNSLKKNILQSESYSKRFIPTYPYTPIYKKLIPFSQIEIFQLHF
jgi:hypothetical protein